MLRWRAGAVLGALLVLLAVLCGRMLWGAHAELRRADAAERAGDRAAVSRHLRRALAHYLPFNPWVRQASGRLEALARQLEREGKPRAALRSWHELRSAILAWRGATTPARQQLARINDRIAALTGTVGETSAALRTSAGRSVLRRRLDRPEAPAAGWTAIGLLGFLLWSGGGAALLLFGLRRDARLVPRRFWPLAAPVAAGLLLFALGMAWA